MGKYVVFFGFFLLLQIVGFRIFFDGVCVCFSIIVEEQVFYGGKVVGESVMVRVLDIGN